MHKENQITNQPFRALCLELAQSSVYDFDSHFTNMTNDKDLGVLFLNHPCPRPPPDISFLVSPTSIPYVRKICPYFYLKVKFLLCRRLYPISFCGSVSHLLKSTIDRKSSLPPTPLHQSIQCSISLSLILELIFIQTFYHIFNF